MRLKPRKTTVFAFIIAVILIILSFYYVDRQKIAQDNIGVELKTSMNNISTSTDNSWQKQFIDKNIAITKTTSQNQKTTNKTNTKPNATDILGMDFLSKYSQLRQSGLNTDSDAIKTATQNIIANSGDYIPKPTSYTYADMKIIDDKSIDVLAKYGKEVMTSIGTAIPKVTETTIATEAFDKNDMTLLKKIDPIMASYKKTLSALKSMNVPALVAKDHLDLMNGVSIQLYNAESLRNADTDPLKGLAGVGMEVNGLTLISQSIMNIERILNLSGIEFVTSS